ncbi:hypothetical protein CEXT_652111 [Caerostris extrusa]|uniref:Uncharacterized protein n=1 Tax=Caerostris extrusa TaxID=172846 RepID=A0AAV4SG25_CAEEX|nr:hypothetical protein CEXT_652111 [Caerostris extrusa]
MLGESGGMEKLLKGGGRTNPLIDWSSSAKREAVPKMFCGLMHRSKTSVCFQKGFKDKSPCPDIQIAKS